MTIADKVTSVRLVLAPFFFVVYLLHHFFPDLAALSLVWTVPVLWVLFIVSEVSDLVDGKIARARNEVSDFGKLFDPFSDVLIRMTYFLCFIIDGILPVFLFLIVLYREFAMLFLRSLMMKKGVAMGASWGGKVKAFVYMLAGAVALIASSLRRLGCSDFVFDIFKIAAVIVFFISVILSATSFIEYFSVYKKVGEKKPS